MSFLKHLFSGESQGQNAELDHELLQAAWAGDAAKASALIDKGASANAKTTGVLSYGTTALMAASDHGHLDVVNLLLSKGARVNDRDDNKPDRSFRKNALMYASRKHHSEIVKVLIAAGADVNARMTGGSTALLEACCVHDRDVVEILLASGADVNVKTEAGWTPLSVATREGCVFLADRLREAGAK